MQVAIKKLAPNAVIPSYAKPGDAGMDMTCTRINSTKDYIEYCTDIAMAIPPGYVGLLFPRSSNSKKALLLCNSVGVIDSGYRGSINFRYKVTDINGEGYALGDKVGQIIIMPFPYVEFVEGELDETERGEGGFGSTNNA